MTPFLRAEFQELQSGEFGDLQRVGECAGAGDEGPQPRQTDERGEAERRRTDLPHSEGQDLQVGMSGGTDALQVRHVGPGHDGRTVAALGAMPLPCPLPVHHEVGEGVGEQFRADDLFVVEHDDLPGVPPRTRRQVDGDPVAAAVVPEGDPAG